MATIVQDFVFFENGGKDAQNILSILKGSILQLSIEGEGLFSLKVEAQMLKNDTFWYPIAIISDKEYELLSVINQDGLYKVDLTGLSQIKIQNMGDGVVTCKGRVVNVDD